MDLTDHTDYRTMPNKLLGKGSLHGDHNQKSYDDQEFVLVIAQSLSKVSN